MPHCAPSMPPACLETTRLNTAAERGFGKKLSVQMSSVPVMMQCRVDTWGWERRDQAALEAASRWMLKQRLDHE